MKFEDLKSMINLAIRKFYERDSILLKNHGSEWSIAHRIAVYLEDYFEDSLCANMTETLPLC